MSVVPFVIGHRGAPVLAPEHSIPGFEAALASGAAGIEFDVRWTADGVPVVLHDATLDRTTTGTGPVRSCTCTGLQSLYLLDGRRQPTRWVVPTMHDVIARFGHRARLFVEVKTDDSPSPEARGREIARALRSANLPCGPLLLSFAPQALIGARETWNTLDTCLLAEPSHSSLGSCPSNLVAEGKDAGASAIGIPDTVVSKVLVRLAHASGLCVYSWGNLEQHLIESGLAACVDLLASDNPGELARLVRPVSP